MALILKSSLYFLIQHVCFAILKDVSQCGLKLLIIYTHTGEEVKLIAHVAFSSPQKLHT